MRGPKLSVYPKGALLETYRRRLIALREDGYNDDFMAALEEVHRHLEKHDPALGAAVQPDAIPCPHPDIAIIDGVCYCCGKPVASTPTPQPDAANRPDELCKRSGRCRHPDHCATDNSPVGDTP